MLLCKISFTWSGYGAYVVYVIYVIYVAYVRPTEISLTPLISDMPINL